MHAKFGAQGFGEHNKDDEIARHGVQMLFCQGCPLAFFERKVKHVQVLLNQSTLVRRIALKDETSRPMYEAIFGEELDVEKRTMNIHDRIEGYEGFVNPGGYFRENAGKFGKGGEDEWSFSGEYALQSHWLDPLQLEPGTAL